MPATRAVAYFRSSTTKQEASIGEQRQFVVGAAPREQLTVVREFEDFGIAGDEITRRAGLQALFAFCEDQHRAGTPIGALVLFDLDRLSRADSVKTAVIIDRLREAGVERAYCQEGWLDLSDELALTMNHLRQDFSRRGYVKSISKNVSRSCRERALTGRWLGGRRPYGYTLGPDKHLARDAAEKADAVTWLFREYLGRDTSQFELARELTRRGVPPPEYHSARRRRAEGFDPKKGAEPGWTSFNVNSILKNPVYTGAMFYARTHQGKHHKVTADGLAACRAVKTASGRPKVQRNSESEQIVVPKAHPALVDAETFRAVQRKLAANKPGFQPGQTRRTFKWLFGNGLLRCGHCGKPMHGRISQGDKNGKHYEWKHYICSTYAREGGKGCGYNCVREDKLLVMVAESIRDHFSDPELIGHIRQTFAEREKARRMEGAGLAAVLRKRVAELERWVKDGNGRLAKVPEDLLPGLVAELRAWKAELETAREELKAAERREQAGRLDEERLTRALDRLQKLPQLIHKSQPALVRELIRSVVECVELKFTSRVVKERRRYKLAGGTIRPTEAARLFGMEDIELPISVK